jgi:Flp pilus assembly protein TadG
VNSHIRRRLSSEHGTAILETALTLPLLLLVSVGLFEFGRAYQTWQVLTNAAREGARAAVVPNAPEGAAEARVRRYLESGQLRDRDLATVVVDPAVAVDIGGGATAFATVVTVTYPFEFGVLQPVARLVVRGSTVGAPVTLTASAEMRNETQ